MTAPAGRLFLDKIDWDRVDRIDFIDLIAAGHLFYLSATGVWLTEQVPVEFIRFPKP